MKRIFYIPEELVEEILVRLPPKSLMRFKCVCKSWYALITDPSFANKHLRFGIDNSKKSSSVSLFLSWTRQELSLDHIFNHRFYGDLDKVFSLVSVCDEDDSNNSHLPCVVQEINLPPTLKHDTDSFINSHCNGIICWFNRSGFCGEIFLCNPSLNEFKLLHTPSLLPEFWPSGFGFGYDARANDYKFVKLFRSAYNPIASRALVYTLGIDSWKEIKMDLKGKFCLADAKGVYCRGVYYWVNKAVPGREDMILSFDMSDEVFHTIALPDCIKRVDGQSPKRLALWNESLVLFFTPANSWFSTSFEMWVMADNVGGVEGVTWTKHLTIRPQRFIHLYSTLTFWKDDEILFETRDGRLVSYNLYSQKLRKLPIHGAVLPGRTSAHLYLKSLVSVRGGTHAKQPQN
ncbi:F-box/kelch-repeat protein [Morus notabilis]|uniref:F-box/kelch-repeat protein n=1 Tax=Morus notabilis TaxID=981085 RepID=W9S0E9_9ROSA|nr:putative F-box protein At3g24700 [Morus notabilis]EXC20033.1 F-box/kelch-repeat protein [Morus notabilis]